MTYQVIARKWRPQTFDEVTGQEPITRTLRNAIEHERLHHAYLFSGARGVGKTTTARLLAKAVNCHRSSSPTATPCAFTDPEACPSCREIAEGRSIDVLEIDAASNTSVDNVRESILNTVGTRPARDRYKVFIIDEVHMLSGSAFNALLKTLEEPPPRVLFIMATTEQHKVPDTILSRCQLFEFRTIAAAKIAERLRLIADAEKIKISEEALRDIARAGEGSMRDAQSAFDQVISFSEGEIGTEDVGTALGIAGAEMLARVVRAVASQTPSDALAVVEDLVMRGHDLRNFCRDLLAHLRDLLVVKVAGDREALSDVSEAERRELSDEAGNFSESDLVRFFHSLTETEQHLRDSAHPRYQLEIGLVKLIEMRRLAPLGQLIERLCALEEALRTGQTPAGGPGASSSSPPRTSFPGGGAARESGNAGGGHSSSSGATADASTSLTTNSAAPTANGSAGAAKTVEENSAPAPVADAARPFNPATAPVRAQPDASSTNRPAIPPPPASPGLKLVPPASPANAHAAPFRTSDPDPTPHGLFETQEPPPSSFFDDIAQEDDRAGRQIPAPAAPFDTTGAAYAKGKTTKATAAAVIPAGALAAPPTSDSTAHPAQPAGIINLIKKALDERRKPFLAIALEGARRAVVEGDELLLEFSPEGKHLRDTLSKPDNLRVVREACCEVLGREIGVRVTIKAPGESDDMPLTEQDEARLEQQRLREVAASRSSVQEALKMFSAEIVEVQRMDGEAV